MKLPEEKLKNLVKSGTVTDTTNTYGNINLGVKRDNAVIIAAFAPNYTYICLPFINPANNEWYSKVLERRRFYG